MKGIDGISVVICCYNSESRIGKVLSHLMEQKNDEGIPWEVVVVDNASTDATAETALKAWKHKKVEIRVVQEMTPGLSHARLKGFAEARFEVISFIDDDNWVEDHWIEKVHEHMCTHPDTGILGGRGEAALEEDEPFWFKEFQRSYAVGPQAERTGPHDSILYGAGFNIRKKAWDTLVANGFEFKLSGRKGKAMSSGEDAELCMAVHLMGYVLYYRDDLTFFHFMPAGRVNWQYLVKLRTAFGKAMPVVGAYRAIYNMKGLEKLKYSNTVFALANCVYNMLRSSLKLLPVLFRDKEGNADYLSFCSKKGHLSQQLRMLFTFHTMVASIKHAEWRKADA